MAAKNRRRMAQWGIGLAVVLFLAVNVIVGNTLATVRADLTEKKLYTLSQGTRDLLANLKEPLHFRLFLSEGLVRQAPQLAAYASRVKTMLQAYAELSMGKIALEVIDPQPYSDEEDRAVGLGVDRVQTAGASEPLFFGLAATNSTDGHESIPVFSPDREAFLEYDLTRMVAKLGEPGKPKVALIDGLGLSGNPMQGARPQESLSQLEDFFDVRILGGDVDSFPEGTAAVMVVHPKDISDRTRYALDQWVMAGKPAMIFVDPYAETATGPQPGMPPPDPSSDLPKLFKAWGVKYDPKKAVADPQFGLHAERNVGGQQVDITNYPWLAIGPEGMDRADPALAQLSNIIVTTAGAFSTEGDGPKLEALLSASPAAGLVDASKAGAPYGDPRELAADIKPGKEPLVIAGRLTGTLKSAFPDGKPEKSEAKGEPLKQSAKPANVILVGDADMLMDRNWLQHQQIFGQDVTRAFANNGDFVLNALEQMAGGPALADLRGRGVSWRPFERIDRLEKAAEEKYLARQRELMKKIDDTEKKLRTLGSEAPAEGGVISPDATKAVQDLRSDLLAARAELRQVQFQLRRDVEELKTRITAANVGMVPALVALLALGAALRRPRRPLPKKGKGDEA